MKKKGFTVIELLVVMIIIAVLAALLLPAIRKARAKALIDKAKAEMANLASIETMVKLDIGYYVPLRLLACTTTPNPSASPIEYDSTNKYHPDFLDIGPDGYIGTGDAGEGNGNYDIGEPKPYEDANNNDQFDTGEITHWDGPYQVFQPKSVLDITNGYGTRPNYGSTSWTDSDFPEGSPLDPWGHPYGLAWNDTEKVMVIYSAGPNGTFETDRGNTSSPADSDDLLYKFR